MKRYFYCLSFLCIFAAVSALTSCKGRTVHNMEPTGDTIEVVINGETAIEEPAADIPAEEQTDDKN